jgi:hypothetical protein
MTTVAQQPHARVPDPLLVTVALFGPAAWVVFILVNYLLEDPLACTPGASVKGRILGVGVRAIGAGIALTLTGVTFVAGAVAAVLWRRLRNTNSTGRRPWMALAGVLNCVLFGFIILVGIAPSVILHTCVSTP